MRPMVITYHGESFVKVSFGDTTLAFNPISKKSKLKQVRFGADIALISQNHPDSNGTENVSHGDKKPFEISGPGEYEVRGVTITGFAGETEYGGSSPSNSSGQEMINTVYVTKLEGMHICYLGHQSSEKLSQATLEALDSVDILFIPVGGNGVLDPSKAHELGVKLEANVVIPISYDDKALKKFLKEEGSDVKPVDKLTIKKKDLETMSGEIVVLK